MLNSTTVARILKGRLLGSKDIVPAGCTIDSRSIIGGEIFFALAGEKVDGHDYVCDAFKKGISIAIGEEERFKALGGIPEVPEGKALILVDSSIDALQELAKSWRFALGSKVVAITGSNGKTTTKDMVAAVLSTKFKVHKNKENFNNELGLPLTILTAPADSEILVLEMGMRGLGQIKALCEIAQPDTGVITNIGTTHLELLGSQERIAQAKWELVDSLPTHGVAIINSEDEWSAFKAQTDSHPKLFYGLRGKYAAPEVCGVNLQPEGIMGTSFQVNWKDETAQASLPLPGEHNVLDALAALAVGVIYGISLEEGCIGLKGLELSKMRLEIKPGIMGSTLISDVYNANPTSMKASLQVLKERAEENTLAILGEMYELGESSEQGHFEVGMEVANLGINELVTVGELAEHIARGAINSGFPIERVHITSNREEAVLKAKQVLNRLGVTPWVLIKGSRGMKMEEITAALLN